MDNFQNSTYQLMNSILLARDTHPETMRVLCEDLLHLSQQEHYDYGIAFAHTYLGEVYVECRNGTEAMRELELARAYSERCKFQDLLSKIHHLTGCCFLIMHDKHSAIDHYLISLELARTLDDALSESLILNDIGSIFDKRNDMEDAYLYYQAAYRLLDTQLKTEDKPHTSLLLYNLSNSSSYLGRLEEAKSYLIELKNLDYEGAIKQIALSSGWYTYAMMTGNKQLALEMVRQILLLNPKTLPKSFTFETLIPTFKGVLELGNEDYSRKILNLMESLCKRDEPEQQKILTKLNILYCKAFSYKDELFHAYQNYFNVINDSDLLIDQLITDGIKARIHLNKVTKENEVMQRQNRDLERAANLDEVTRLYNRRYFNAMLNRIKTGELRRKVGFIILDIDYFKEYNDCYGHAQGDEILKNIAHCLMACAASNIYPCRHGGDEFACLCLDMDDHEIEQYIKNVQQMLSGFRIPHQDSHCSSIVSLSSGYCNQIHTKNTDIHLLLDTADQALYKAKALGRNQFCGKY